MPDPGDLAALSRLANELFRALPGAPAMAPAAVPTPATALAPASLPAQASGVVPAGIAPVAIAPAGIAPAAIALELPPGLLPAGLPAAPTPPGLPLHGLALPSLPLPSLPLPQVPPLGVGLPNEAELLALLAPVAGASAPRTVAGVSAPRTVAGVSAPRTVAGVSAPRTVPPAPLGGLPYFFQEAEAGRPDAAVPAFYPPADYDVQAVRRDFPLLAELVHGKPLIWLDNGATTQKPRAVIDRLSYFYEHENSNIHRGAHALAARATDAYEAARDSVRRFLNANSAEEIVFVRGTTEGINLVAQSWGKRFIGSGDEIVITWLEHHANIVPWQMLAAETGAKLRVAPVDDDGQVILEEFGALLGPRTKLVAFTQVSNALGTITPARTMIEMAHRVGARVLLDGAQSVPHMAIDVQALDCDWFVFSGHKVFGPTGIGAVYGKRAVLAESPPWQGGGNMIRDVTFEHTEYNPPPTLFEAGTGNIADAVGLATALDYVQAIGLDAIARHEHDLLGHATRLLDAIPGLRLLGRARDKAGVLSFVMEGVPTEDLGRALDAEGIAVRSGHHCAQPILRRFGVEGSVRASLALYNTHADIDALAAALRRIRYARPASA